jgi:hypothetical protein
MLRCKTLRGVPGPRGRVNRQLIETLRRGNSFAGNCEVVEACERRRPEAVAKAGEETPERANPKGASG